ncbi:MAG TPA: SDR family NAD(P)-dependent oxidoreductase [Thermoanaerobaculia bacterium]|jgi:NAD(P)-dependent dehydrogenase (short-subunit alcohol dehydrogenase family)
MPSFAEYSVLVAGGTGGLGRAVALAFLAEGGRVAVTFRNPGELAELKRAAGAGAVRLEGHASNVTDEQAVRRLVDEVLKREGRLDVLVNAVGGFTGGKPLWEENADALDRMLALNLRPGWALARAVAPAMLAQGHGAIVNVAAQAALAPPAGLGAYAASKAAATALLASLAADLKGTGVRANTILPSIIDTPANRKSMPDADFSKWPKPEEIARVVLFLASDEAKLVNGAAIPV